MKVIPYTVNSFKAYNPIFKSNYRGVANETGEVDNWNSTFLFRNDIEWINFVNFLDKKYTKADKVNTICYGCSDGAEPVSLTMLLCEKLGNSSNKFFPIIAKDKDEFIINEAKKFEIPAFYEDFIQLNNIIGNDKEKYLKVSNTEKDGLKFLVDKRLKDKIHYEQADILEDVHNIPSKNSVVLCRNFWPYLSDMERELLARRLSNRLKDNCTLVIGDFDKNVNVPHLLESVGFRETSVENVFEK